MRIDLNDENEIFITSSNDVESMALRRFFERYEKLDRTPIRIHIEDHVHKKVGMIYSDDTQGHAS